MAPADVIKEKLGQNILLLTHHNADPDSVCSALILQEALKKLGANSQVGVIESASKLAKKIIKKYGCEIKKDPPLDVDFIVLLDASSPGQLSDYAEKFKASKAFKLIIDHHTGQEEKLDADSYFIDEGSTSTISMVLAILKELGVELDKKMAFIALFGTVAETAHLRYADASDFKLIGELLKKHKIKYTEILNLLATPLDVSERIARLNSVQRTKYSRVKDYLIATSYVGSFEASVARALVNVGADLAVVNSIKKDEIRVSIRANHQFHKETGIDVSKDLIPEIAKIINGSGGGHPTVAGANGKDVKKNKEVCDFVVNEVKKRVGAKK